MKIKKQYLLVPFFILGITFFMHSSCKKDATNNNNQPAVTDLTGNWKITGTLASTTNPDPNAPQPGFQAMDQWNVTLNAGIPRLTTSKGSVDGSGVNNGYHFEGQYDVAPGLVWVVFKIEFFPSVQYNKIYGTEEFKYWGLNGVGQPMFLGTESWAIAGEKL